MSKTETGVGQVEAGGMTGIYQKVPGEDGNPAFHF